MGKFKKFIDTLRISVKGGAGGMGLPKYAGIGGKGGSVYLEAKSGMNLMTVLQKYSKKIVTAESGENSSKFKIIGEAGKDKIVPVPVGVTVYDEFMRKIGELNKKNEKVLVAEGGPGGAPKSVPPYSGSKGHSRIITIDLKLIADVGLVGFPNAGKSTLLKAVSRAKPEIAAYAFTTLRPNIGIIQYPDFRQIQVADLPGLVEGASHNVGMGHKFLKHVERSSLLLMVVDIHGFQLSPVCKHRNCLETIILLNKELELYKKELLIKPAILAINKMDLPGARATYKEITPHLKNLEDYASTLPEDIRPENLLNFHKILPISAMCDAESVEELKKAVRQTLDDYFEYSLMEDMTKEEMNILKKIRQQSYPATKVSF